MNVNELFTRNNLKILKLINQEELHIRQIATKLDISPGTVHKLVKTLKENNLIVETKIKNRLLIKFNYDNPLADQIMDVIEQKGTNPYVEKYRHLLKRRWYVQTFNATPAFIHIGGVSITTMKKDIGYGYRSFVKDFKDDFCHMYYDRDDLHRLAHELEDRQFVDFNYVHSIMAKWKGQNEEMVQFIEKNIPKLKKFSDKELISKYKEMSRHYNNTNNIAHVLEGYSLTRDVRLKNLLIAELEKKDKGKEFHKYFTIITAPIRKSFINKYNNILSEIYNEIKKNKIKTITKENLKQNKNIWDKIKLLEKKFYWVRANYKDARKLTADDFIKEIKGMVDEGEEFKNIPEKVFENNLNTKNKVMKELKFCKPLIDMINMTDFLTNWQDDRKEYILIGCAAMDEFTEEIGKRFNIKHQHVRYMLPEEMTFEKLKKLPASFFEERVKGCFVIYEEDKFDILTGEDYKEFKKALEQEQDGDETKDIHGMCASVGKTTGRVHICKTTNDINNFKRGEILVTGMTRPEFVPAMSKAAAIVTDEGGITSHAAVISRELGIPCVIGTKNATKLLKNGDLVDINANHGLVQIVK
ncbi:MAG: PEP-utilizing enzyme [archaeon]